MTDFAQRFQTGAAVYGCLQGLYTYPVCRDTITTLLEIEPPGEQTEPHLDFLRSIFEKSADSDDYLEQLDIEFTRLFVGPGQNPAPPYASFYLNGATLMGPEALTVRSFYLDWGMVPLELDRVPDDHISLELAFMGYLCGEANAALIDQDVRQSQALFEAQLEFMHNHLLTWVPHFCSEVISATHEDFFIGLSRLTQTQLEADSNLLADLIAAATPSLSAPHG